MTEHRTDAVGAPLSRRDGAFKVMGAAKYTYEVPIEGVACGLMVQSTIAQGTIKRIDTSAAEAASGVIAVMTHENAPRLPAGAQSMVRPPAERVLSLLQDNRVRYNGEPIAVVIAESFEEARYAASLIRVEYESETPDLDFRASLTKSYPYTRKILGRDDASTKRGDVDSGLREADVTLDLVYTTPIETHNPMEPHSTLAKWDGDYLTLYDSTQFVYGVRRTAAHRFGIPEERVRVISQFVGGAFGSKGAAWSHVILTAMAAKLVDRPVKMTLTRRQMFGPVGARPYTVQHVLLAAKKDGALTAMRHICTSSTSKLEDWVESSTLVTRMLYQVPNQETSQLLVKLNTGTPTFNRAPGESTGTFALETAMDELAVKLGIDPIELRLKNYAEKDPESGQEWSSKALRECYRVASEKFGWSKRDPRPRSMRDGDWLVGYGMASATYPMKRMPAKAEARILPDGTVAVRAATHEIGTGTFTVMAQIAADAAGVNVDGIALEIGDTDLPENPISAGSMTAASTGSAIHVACTAALEKLIAIAVTDDRSPLHDCARDDIEARDGRLSLKRNPAQGETFAAIIARHGGDPIEAHTESKPGEDQKKYGMHAFGSVFVEVRVDPDLGVVRVSRIVAAYGAGRILNPKTARSQIIGGIVYGIGMAMLEDTAIDKRTGRYVNAELDEYHLPVNADVPDIDVTFVDEQDDKVNPIGVKGIGEIGITGVAAAICNAVYHATGVRVRDLPITLDKVIGINPPATTL